MEKNCPKGKEKKKTNGECDEEWGRHSGGISVVRFVLFFFIYYIHTWLTLAEDWGFVEGYQGKQKEEKKWG